MFCRIIAIQIINTAQCDSTRIIEAVYCTCCAVQLSYVMYKSIISCTYIMYQLQAGSDFLFDSFCERFFFLGFFNYIITSEFLRKRNATEKANKSIDLKLAAPPSHYPCDRSVLYPGDILQENICCFF